LGAALRAGRVVQFPITAAAPATASSKSAAAATGAATAVPATLLGEAVPAVDGTALGGAEGNLRFLTTGTAGCVVHFSGPAVGPASGSKCH
jgi:hypothetical protein